MSNPLGQFYNGLLTSINKRFSRGFSVLGSYTWSKNIDYNSTNNNMEDSTIQTPSTSTTRGDWPTATIHNGSWDPLSGNCRARS